MTEKIAIFKNGRCVYSTGLIGGFVLDAVTSLDEIARKVYDDKFVSFDVDGCYVNYFIGFKDTMIISCSKKRNGKRQLNKLYEAYCICEAYNTMSLMSVFLE